MKLDFTQFKKAIKSLSEAVQSTTDTKFMASLNDAQRRTMRAGVIQNFEFTYEKCWKILQKQLQLEEGSEEVLALSRKDLFRLGAQKSLLENPESWFVYHRARNETSHTYNEATAQEVYQITLQFLPDAEKLLLALEARYL